MNSIHKYSYQDFKTKIDETWQKYMDKTAIVHLLKQERASLKYAQVLEICENLSKSMKAIEIGRAARVAVISPYSAQSVLLNLALAYGGYTAVLIDASLPQEEYNRLLEYADVSAVFTTNEILKSIDKKQIESMPFFEIKNDFSYELFPNSVRLLLKKVTEPLNEDVIAILFSSGTTGTMKGVEITYSSIIYAHKYMVKYTNLTSDASFLDVLPPNHIAGYSSVMSCALTGTELGFITEVNAQSLAQAFQEYKPTNFIMIPKIYELIMQKIQDAISKKFFLIRGYAHFAIFISGAVRKITGIKLRWLTKPIYKAALGENMKICGCGTAPCSKSLIEFYLRLGIDFVDVYGTTETGFPIAAANCNEKYPTIGCGNVKLFPEISIVIEDSDEYGVGEIRVKTPLIMGGYYKESELTATAFDENGYFKTGDSGYIDKNGYLHVTGRIKENIVLPNGKKVSPVDVDNYYLSRIKGYDIASKGVSVPNEKYDEIHLFISADKLSECCKNEAINLFRQASNTAPSMYKLSDIHLIPQIPKTTVGKIKRFCLDIPEEAEKMDESPKASNVSYTPSSVVYGQIRKITKIKEELNNDMRLKEDVGMDSLQMFELYTVINEKFGVSVEEYLNNNVTIGLLIEAILQANTNTKSTQYPSKRTEKDYRYIEQFHFCSKLIWNFQVSGITNIMPNEQYIFCANHESLFDGIWIMGFIERKLRHNTYCLAASHLFEKKWLRKGVIGMGGIPVYRTGNASLAMKIAEKCLLEKGGSLFIHPEGTRSRDGKLGEFKHGAAQLAIKLQIKIVPICIEGAYEVFPPHRKWPHIFDWKNLRRYKIRITFGKPLDPKGKNVDALTTELRDKIIEMSK